MDTITKRAIFDYAQSVDPHGDVVRLEPSSDWSGGRIRFSDAITKHREETALKGEKYVEAYLVLRLIKELGYPAEMAELQREYPAGHPKTDRPRIDVIIRQPISGSAARTWFFVEAKDPDEYEEQHESAIERQLYPLADHERTNNLKYLVYYTVRFDGNHLVEDADIIDFETFPNYDSWQKAGRPALDILPSNYGLATKSTYVNKSPNDLELGERALDRSVGRTRFAALRRNLHNVLWGGGGMFYNDIFSNLIKLFLAKIYDEETTSEGDPYRFQVRMIGDAPEPPSGIYGRMNALYLEAQRQYLGYSEEQITRSRGIDTEKMSESKVAYVVARVQDISLVDNRNQENGDVLGDFFEGIVEEGFKQSRGQFFTHLNLVHFLIHALGIPEAALSLVNGEENPAKPRLPFVADPACGSGTFLIETMKLVSETIAMSPRLKRSVRNRQFLESMFPTSKPNRWADTYLYGVEVNADLALATKVNMVLHGDGNINIFCNDGLAEFSAYGLPDKVSALTSSSSVRNFPYQHEVNEQFDFVLSNPPFSITPEEHTREGYGRRFEFGGNAKSENLFLERWYQLLRPRGRLGVVLPESVCDTPTNRPARLFLYRYFKVDAVISLPYLAFQPYTSTKTCLLICTKKTSQEVLEYSALWSNAQATFRKAQRRISAWLAAENVGDRGKVRNLLARDDGATRSCLADILRCGDNSTETIECALRELDADNFEYPDEVQWVFGRVASELDYQIFMCEAQSIGYKRRRQGGDLNRANDLFERSPNGKPLLRRDTPRTVLEKYLAESLPDQRLDGFTARFRDIANQPFLRCDPKYRWFWDRRKGRLVGRSKYGFAPLSGFVRLAPKTLIRKGQLDEERKLIELEDVESKTGHILNVRLVDEIGSDKVVFGDADVLFSKLEPYLAKAILNNPQEAYIGSSEWVPLQVVLGKATREYIWLLLLSPAARTTFRFLQSGKRHARLHILDFANILVPTVPLDAQKQAVNALKPVWRRVKEIRRELERRQKEIEDKVDSSLSGVLRGD